MQGINGGNDENGENDDERINEFPWSTLSARPLFPGIIPRQITLIMFIEFSLVWREKNSGESSPSGAM